ncbi:Peroxiredoxin Q, chloroplastic [Rhizoctonia solani]|uniref:thioredoxin-dependent peroxiredoxin n=1 Tax=Rhizoctonia solani TaxID=456999 RepID=A0A0K6G4B1_9AGAM|nr:Peroxiredoxin Q, chloroplastic [Rhizoctonia solani]
MPGPKSLIGQPAPALNLPSATGEQFELDPATAGRPTVIFFFPAAGTFGCTREACSFRDALSSNELYKTHNVQIIGISGDAVAKQKAFVDAQGLSYPMLCDTEGEARKKYLVGKALLGLSEARVTFCIDKEGLVRSVFDSSLQFTAHEKAVAKWLGTLPKPGPAGEPDEPIDFEEPELESEPQPGS